MLSASEDSLPRDVSRWEDLGNKLDVKLSAGDKKKVRRRKKFLDDTSDEGKRKSIKKDRIVAVSESAPVNDLITLQQAKAEDEKEFPNESLGFFKKVNQEMTEKLESEKKDLGSLANVHSKIANQLDRRIHIIGSDPRIGNDEDLQRRHIERSTGAPREKMTLMRNISAEERLLERNAEEWGSSQEIEASRISDAADTITSPDVSSGQAGDFEKNDTNVSSEYQEKEGEIGVTKEDSIVEGFGVVGDASPEIVMEGDGEQKMGDVVSEKSGNSEGGENVLEGEYLPDGEESLQELRDRVKTLKGSSDEARNRFLTLRHRNTSKWLAVKKALFSLRSKEPPQALVDEMEALKGDWNYKLTLYKDAVVELTKREAAERKFDGKARGELMAEAIRELDVRGSVENYDAWKNASWGDRKDSEFLRMLGRARDWAEEYRKLDWKKRVAISAVVVGTGVAGVAVGSAGLVGLGVAGSTIVRLLGSYGAGRGSYEFLEGRANQKTLQYHEAALSNVEKIEDIGFLEERMRSYADRTQKDLDRAIAGNRKRVAASVALGSVLFLGGTAFAHRGAIQEFSGKVSNEFSKFLEQVKIITGFEDFHMAPVSISGGVADRAAEMAGAAKRVVIERAQEGVVLPDTSSGEIPHPIPTPPIVDAGAPVESGGLVSGNAGAGVIDGGQAAEAAGKIVEGDASEIGKILVAGKDGNSFEGMFMNAGYDETASHRAVLRFMREAGVTQEKMDKIFGGAKAIIVPDDSDPKTPFRIIGITRESGGAIISTTKVPGTEDLIRKITDASELSNAVPQGVSSAVELGQVSNIELPKIESAVEVSPLEPTHIQEIQPAVQLESMESVSLPEIETLPSSPEPPDAFDRYGTVAKVIPPVAGLATAGVVGKTLLRMKRDRDEKIFKKSQEILSQVPRLMDISRAQRVALDTLRISEIFASSSKENPADTLVFNEAKKRVCSVLFGSESVPENLVSRSLSEFITNEEENDDAKIRDRLRKGFSIFQNLFSQTGGRIPKEVLRTLTVGDVPDIVTKRFIERQSS